MVLNKYSIYIILLYPIIFSYLLIEENKYPFHFKVKFISIYENS